MTKHINIDEMDKIDVLLDDVFWLGFKLCMAGKVEISPNEKIANAKRKLKDLMLEIIGEDENKVSFSAPLEMPKSVHEPMLIHQEARNGLRAEQRQAINQLKGIR